MSTPGPAEPADAPAPSPAQPPSSARRPRRFGRRAPGGAHEPDQKKPSLLRELPVLLVVAFVLALLVKTFLVQAFFIPSGSMEQTLHGCPGCTGDRVLVNKVPYWFAGQPSPGDIVVFKGPDTWPAETTVAQPTNIVSKSLLAVGRAVGVAPPSEDDFVKRVIATAGQTVQCCDDQGRVTVDGEPLTEPYIYQDSPLGGGPCQGREFGPVTVPAGRLWVMGDHRSNSADSRCHIDDKYSGTVGVDDVIGKASVIVWPVHRWSWLGSPDPQHPDAQGAAAAGAPYLAGVAGALPVTAAGRLLRTRRRGARPRSRSPRSRWRRSTRDAPPG